MAVKKGDKVKVDYEGKLESGEIFDSSKHGDHSHPLEFTVGSRQVIKGFDDALIGMKINEEKEIKITPEDGYGHPKKEIVKEMPIKVLPPLPDGGKPEEGMALLLSTPSGQKFPAKIAKITKTNVTLDLNHPLAGKTLIFKIKLIGIN
ncbi:MAG: peptidylprolyl isomerase [Nanoarchaeota archaeon]